MKGKFILAVLFLLAFAPLASAATTLSIGSYMQESGEILIPVMLNTTEMIGNLQFSLIHNMILNTIEVTPGTLTNNSLLDWRGVEYSGTPPYRSLTIGIVNVVGFTGYGSVAVVRFNISISRLGGRTRLEFGSPKANRAGTFEPITVGVFDGTFTVGRTLGDCDGNGRIEAADALLALRMAIGKVPPNLGGCDVDGSGLVETVDASRILKMALERLRG